MLIARKDSHTVPMVLGDVGSEGGGHLEDQHFYMMEDYSKSQRTLINESHKEL